MRKVPFISTISKKKFNLLIAGVSLSPQAIAAIKRANASGLVRVYGSAKLVEQLATLGMKVMPFTDEIKDAVIGYPNCGLPASISEGLTATKDSHLQQLSDSKKTVIHGVFTEFERLIESETENTVTYNVTDALNKALDGRRITMTRYQQLNELVDTFEKMEDGQLTEEVYEALAICNSERTWKAMNRYSASVLENLAPQTETAKQILADLGVEVNA